MKNKILYLLIILILLFFLIITYYNFKIKPSADNLKSSNEIVSIVPVKENKITIDKKNNTDLKLYSKYINYKLNEFSEFNLTVKEETENGKVFLENNILTINIPNKNINKRFEELKIKTFYLYNMSKAVYIYSISTDNKLYFTELVTFNEKDYKMKQKQIDRKFTNFTLLRFSGYAPKQVDYFMVLSDDGNMYEANTGIPYSESIFNINTLYFIGDNRIIMNSIGNILIDEKGSEYKIKYLFEVDTNLLPDNPNLIIITEDERILYLKNANNKNLYITEPLDINIDIISEKERTVILSFIYNNKAYNIKAYYYDFFGL